MNETMQRNLQALARRWPVLLLIVLVALFSRCDTRTSRDYTVETGDLHALRELGRLRVVVPGTVFGEPALPRQGSPMILQHELARSFATSLGLELELVPVFQLKHMFMLLAQGKGDIIAANLTITAQRRQWIDFSYPIDHVTEQILVVARDESINAPKDLIGRTVMVDRASSFWKTLSALQEQHPGIELIPRPDKLDDEAVLDLVAQGKIDATVRDSNIVEMYLGYRKDLRVAFAIKEAQPIAWGVRPDAPELLAALNRFLTLEQMTRPHETRYLDDLEGLKARRVLRILLPNTAASYFLWRGELVGFEYELAQRFAKQHGMRLEVVVPPVDLEQPLDWLHEGIVDIAAGFLKACDVAEHPQLQATHPFHYAQPYLLSRSDADALTDWDDLNGRRIAVLENSASLDNLSQLASIHALSLHRFPPPEDASTLVDLLAAGEYDYAVLDEHLLSMELARRDDLKRQFSVGEPTAHVWLVHTENTQLLEALNEFFLQEYRGTFYNLLHRKYFNNPPRLRQMHDEGLAFGEGRFSPWDELIRSYARQYDFDWRLIVAQMYQESRFDPVARSPMGAVGLMQLMPATARQVGLTRLEDPEENIKAGIRYMDWIRQRFPEDLPVADRMWFTLAAYNAGIGHVMDARRLAEAKGWDRNRWFDHVEKAILLLAQPHYAAQARYGYVRGTEPVNYVADIRARYSAYVRLTEEPLIQADAAH